MADVVEVVLVADDGSGGGGGSGTGCFAAFFPFFFAEVLPFEFKLPFPFPFPFVVCLVAISVLKLLCRFLASFASRLNLATQCSNSEMALIKLGKLAGPEVESKSNGNDRSNDREPSASDPEEVNVNEDEGKVERDWDSWATALCELSCS